MSTATKAPALTASSIAKRLKAAGLEVLRTSARVHYERVEGTAYDVREVVDVVEVLLPVLDDAGARAVRNEAIRLGFDATIRRDRSCPVVVIVRPEPLEDVVELVDVDEVLDERRQAEAPAPALPGIDAAIVEAELGGRQELELVVVPCSGAKLEQAAPAGELYTGTLHAAARAAADATIARRGGRAVVLSALYGLVELDRVVDPYDLTVGDPGAIDPVGLALQLAATGAVRVIALTPNRYTELLRQACQAAGVELSTPLAGCRGIGEQRGRLAAIRRGDLDVVRAA